MVGISFPLDVRMRDLGTAGFLFRLGGRKSRIFFTISAFLYAVQDLYLPALLGEDFLGSLPKKDAGRRSPEIG